MPVYFKLTCLILYIAKIAVIDTVSEVDCLFESVHWVNWNWNHKPVKVCLGLVIALLVGAYLLKVWLLMNISTNT